MNSDSLNALTTELNKVYYLQPRFVGRCYRIASIATCDITVQYMQHSILQKVKSTTLDLGHFPHQNSSVTASYYSIILHVILRNIYVFKNKSIIYII